MREATCKSCGAKIVWIATASGKRMPCDAKMIYYRQVPGGKDRIVTPNGVVFSGQIIQAPNSAHGVGFVPHWSTCPQADSHRRKEGPTK